MLKNSGRLKPYDYCGACTFYLGAIVVTLICQALAGVVSSLLAKSYPGIEKSGDFSTAFMIVIQSANLAFILLFSKLNEKRLNFSVFRGEDGTGFSVMYVIMPVVCAAVLLVAMYLPTVWYGYFTRYALRIPPEAGNISLTTTSSVIMIVAASVFLAPVCEEAIYRGVLFNGLTSERGVLRSVLLSALAFMLMHMSPMQVVFQFSLGVLSAFIMHKSGRLYPSVILHSAANALALVMQLTPLAAVLDGCVVWLTQNIAAAVFITVGLFAGGFAVLYLLVKRGIGHKFVNNNGECGSNADFRSGGDEQPESDAKQTFIDQSSAASRRKDGTFRFWLAVAISGLLFLINLITLAVGS